jgi:3-dehydroquinate synthase
LRGRQVALFTNKTVNRLYGERLRAAFYDLTLDVFEMGDGEAFKTLETYTQAMEFLMSKRHHRTTCLIALGGGVVGDLTGFVAATFQRGVDFLQIPTTLLAQVDSSVGGKTAVNHDSGKNMIGAFYQPRAVVIDTRVLDTLPAREFAAGMAEVAKYGVIADADFFAWLEAHVQDLLDKESDALTHVIKRSCELKAAVVAADERETGRRAILNFGHTFGHAIEHTLGYGRLLHGEAVAVGMVMAATFSEKLGLLSRSEAERVTRLLHSLGLPTSLKDPVAADDMLAAMGMDKKTADGKLHFVLAERIGAVRVDGNCSEAVLRDVLSEFCG